jgi:hypothetical protein
VSASSNNSKPHLFNRITKVTIGHPCGEPQAKFRFLSQAGGFISGQRAGGAKVWLAKFHALNDLALATMVPITAIDEHRTQ